MGVYKIRSGQGSPDKQTMERIRTIKSLVNLLAQDFRPPAEESKIVEIKFEVHNGPFLKDVPVQRAPEVMTQVETSMRELNLKEELMTKMALDFQKSKARISLTNRNK